MVRSRHSIIALVIVGLAGLLGFGIGLAQRAPAKNIAMLKADAAENGGAIEMTPSLPTLVTKADAVTSASMIFVGLAILSRKGVR